MYLENQQRCGEGFLLIHIVQLELELSQKFQFEIEFESNSESRSSTTQIGGPGHIWSQFWVLNTHWKYISKIFLADPSPYSDSWCASLGGQNNSRVMLSSSQIGV